MTQHDFLPPGLFITGTDTDVGKTWVTALIARQLTAEGVRVGAYKPVCSGGVVGPDGEMVWHDIEELSRAIGGTFDQARVCPQRFRAALAPPVAARLEGAVVDRGLLRAGAEWWRGRVDLLLVEGAGGLLCPLTEVVPEKGDRHPTPCEHSSPNTQHPAASPPFRNGFETIADLAVELGYPVIVVARLGLGTINHTLLTVEAARRRGLTVAGVVMNQSRADEAGPAAETNPAELAARCDVPVLGVIAHKCDDGLHRDGRPIRIDWLSLTRPN